MPGSDPSLLIRSLQRRELFPHPVTQFDVRETHISWVLLTGLYAYKIKKPLDLGFLDFSTLEKRRHFCEEEVRLNKRLADDLYLAVVAITGTPDHPELDGPGAAIEYAVKMIQFPERNQLDKVLARGELQASHIDLLAKTVADFHAGVPEARRDTPFGEPDRLYHPVQENFEQIEPLLDPREDRCRFEAVKVWSQQRFQELRPTLAQRKGDGFVRECHGDMHLANMAFFKGRLIVFDCIEFSENLRWIDVMSEVGFATMDLDARGQKRFGQRFLNRYLERTGDYGGLQVLRFYQTYRAMVRAKVARIRWQQAAPETEARQALLDEYQSYLNLAARYTEPGQPLLAITHGVSGSGKTTLTQDVLEVWGAVRIRSDIERKRLFGLTATARSASALGGGLYTPEAGSRTYERLAVLAEASLSAGVPVLVDATFLRQSQRDELRALAHRLQVPFAILAFEAPEAVLRQRVSERLRVGMDASEADLDVLEKQLGELEPLSEQERETTLTIASDQRFDATAAVQWLAARARP